MPELYVAQAILKFDAEIVEKGHLHIENKKATRWVWVA